MSGLRVALTSMLAIGLAACGSRGGKEHDHAEDKPGGHGDEHGEHKPGAHGDEHGDEPGKAGLVTLTPEQVTTAKIATAVAETRAVSSEIAATGEIVPPDDGVARIGAKLPGRLTRLSRGVGDVVERGQVLASLDSPELGRAKADFIVAATTAKVTRESADREKALFDKQISSERDWREAEADASRARAEKEAAELRLHTLGLSEAQVHRLNPEDHYGASVAVTSPIKGVVVERPVSLGQMVEPQDTLFVVMDLSSVWVQVDVYERDLSQVALGQSVAAHVQAWGERTFTGTITSIGAIIDRRSRTVKVRVTLPNADGALKPGMFAAVVLGATKGEARDGLFVPASAVQRDGDGAIVFVPVGDHEFQLRAVELGAHTAEWVEITRGVVAGERVVTAGTFLLKSEARRGSFGGHQH